MADIFQRQVPEKFVGDGERLPCACRPNAQHLGERQSGRRGTCRAGAEGATNLLAWKTSHVLTRALGGRGQA